MTCWMNSHAKPMNEANKTKETELKTYNTVYPLEVNRLTDQTKDKRGNVEIVNQDTGKIDRSREDDKKGGRMQKAPELHKERHKQTGRHWRR